MVLIQVGLDVAVLVPPLTGRGTLNKSYNISEPYFHLQIFCMRLEDSGAMKTLGPRINQPLSVLERVQPLADH